MPIPKKKTTADVLPALPAGKRKSVTTPTAAPGQDGRVGRGSRRVSGGGSIVADIATHIGTYIYLPQTELLVSASWILAAWQAQSWDRFPHLAVTSLEPRCGKTHFLQLVEGLVPEPYNTASISPAAVYRLIEAKGGSITLLIDEAQSISGNSDFAQMLRELMNASIDRRAMVYRCSGDSHDVKGYPIYSPKVIALIGALNAVLADRCLPILLKRKTDEERTEQIRIRIVDAQAEKLREKIEAWVEEHSAAAAEVYDSLEPLPIANDRMAELLLPLQASLTVADPDRLPELEAYAVGLDERDRQEEQQSPGIRLLTACRDIFTKKGKEFIPTENLRIALCERTEEPWATWTRGGNIGPEALAGLLRKYSIKPQHDKTKTIRGYHISTFRDAWSRYAPAP